jgi:hypothetical protein
LTEQETGSVYSFNPNAGILINGTIQYCKL